MKRIYTLSPILIIFITSILFVGCFGVDGNFSNLRNKILNSTGNKYYTDVEFSIGSFGISIAKIAVKNDDKDQDTKEILNNISHVQVGVYKNHHNFTFDKGYKLLDDINSEMTENGWQYVVKSCCKNEMTGVYVKVKDNEDLKELFVVSLNHNELTLVEVKGNLEKVLEAAIRKKGFNLDHSFAIN